MFSGPGIGVRTERKPRVSFGLSKPMDRLSTSRQSSYSSEVTQRYCVTMSPMETQPYTEAVSERLAAFKQTCSRRILKVKYIDHVPYEEVPSRANMQRLYLMDSEKEKGHEQLGATH